MVTQAAIAKQWKLSKFTVSRILNGKTVFQDATRTRVLNLAAQLSYRHLLETPLRILLLGSLLCAGSNLAAEQPAPLPEPVVWRYLTTGQAASVTEGWLKTKTDASIGGGPLRIAGQRFEKGLGTHPPGEMVFKL